MKLTEDSFIIYAAQAYINPNCISTDEFLEDLQRFKYLKKLFFSYKTKNKLRERLILNHLIILYNTFEARACTRMLFFRLEEYHSYLAPFLLMMGYLPDRIEEIRVSDIALDQNIVDRLREITREVR